MRTINTVFSTLLLLFLSANLTAAPVSKRKAKAIAQSFMGQKNKTTAAPRLAYTMTVTGKPEYAYYYVFNYGQDDGFVIVSGDDRTPEILGYSHKGNLNPDNAPAMVKSFLQGYADEIKQLDNITFSTTAAQTEVSRDTVSPLLTTTWNQGSPYNDSCPVIAGSKSVTGCVATAMSQVMRYYKWPAQTIDSIPSYSYNFNGVRYGISGEKAALPFDWDNMTEYYSDESTDEQRQAVSVLMLAAGKSVEAFYAPDSYGGTSASNARIVPALRKYFDYSARYIDRTDYTLSGFEDILYKEVAASKPVIFCGTSSGGGHCLVIDGYDGNGLFHVNWGWGGMSDGYFRISVLNPNNVSSIGASTTGDGFTMDQGAVIGITKGAHRDTVDTGLAMSVREQTINNSNQTVDIKAYNTTGATHTFDYALAVIREDSTVRVITRIQTNQFRNNYGPGNTVYSFKSSGLSAGTYKMALVSRLSGQTQWIYNHSKLMTLTIGSDGKATASEYTGISHLSVTNWEMAGSGTSRKTQLIRMTIENTGGEFYGTMYLISKRDGQQPIISSNTGLTIMEGSTTELDMEFWPDSAGTYILQLCGDASGKNVLGSASIDIEEVSLLTTDLSSLGFELENHSGDVVYGNAAAGTVAVRNNDNYDFYGKLTVVLFKFESYMGHETDRLEQYSVIKAGEVDTISFYFDNLVPDTQYALQVYDDMGSVIGRIDFTAKDVTDGIKIAVTRDDDADAPVYNISGQRVDRNYKGIVIINGKKRIIK